LLLHWYSSLQVTLIHFKIISNLIRIYFASGEHLYRNIRSGRLQAAAR
jgi:hypothetical protein